MIDNLKEQMRFANIIKEKFAIRENILKVIDFVITIIIIIKQRDKLFEMQEKYFNNNLSLCLNDNSSQFSLLLLFNDNIDEKKATSSKSKKRNYKVNFIFVIFSQNELQHSYDD